MAPAEAYAFQYMYYTSRFIYERFSDSKVRRYGDRNASAQHIRPVKQQALNTPGTEVVPLLNLLIVTIYRIKL